MSITEKTRIGTNIAGFVTIVTMLGWLIAQAMDWKWRVTNVENRQGQLETAIKELPTKHDFVQVRVELQQLQAANEATMKALRRRPR